MYKKLGFRLNLDADNYGQCLTTEEFQPFVFVSSDAEAPVVTLAHELIHVCMHVLDSVGIEIEVDTSEEALAYLHSYLFKKALDKIKF